MKKTIRRISCRPGHTVLRKRCLRPLRASLSARPKRKLRFEKDVYGIERVAYEKEGWESWKWRGIKVNYIAYGTSGPPILLIHGFGASAYQWRYNIPVLGKTHRVYAMDLVGFGKSEKLVTDYSGGQVWGDQIGDFIEELIGTEGTYVAGNSLGGLAALIAASKRSHLIKGLIGLDIAGSFSEDMKPPRISKPREDLHFIHRTIQNVEEFFKRILIWYAFILTRSNVKRILMRVYHNKNNVDDDLVRSIVEPARDPVALEVCYKLVQSMFASRASLDGLLRNIDVPFLLLWGMKDPCITPKTAERIVEAYKKTELIRLEAGHCAQDECPDLVNQHLTSWIKRNEK